MNYDKLRKAVDSSKITITDLCIKLDIDRKTFYNNIQTGSMRIDVLEKLCAILKMPITEFFDVDMPQVREPGGKYGAKSPSEIETELLQALRELNQLRKEKENWVIAKKK